MFPDRHDAGRLLGARLAAARAAAPSSATTPSTPSAAPPLVLGLPRGGVPVAAAVADALGAELDVLVVRKLGAPDNPEVALGAVGEDGVLVIDHATRRALHVSDDEVELLAEREHQEVERRVAAFRAGARPLGLAGRDVVIVDDGLATGATAEAAVRVARRLGAARVTLAVPVGSIEACGRLAPMVDEFVCLERPDPFHAVGQHYGDFRQVPDEVVVDELAAHGREAADPVAASATEALDIAVPVGTAALAGWLTARPTATGLVVFAHGTGSGRDSPRNQSVARQLEAGGLGTLLVDLSTGQERAAATEVPLPEQAARLAGVLDWAAAQPDLARLPVGCFGASSGAAVALLTAAERPDLVRAVVSRGGRVDLAGPWLPLVTTPTLLIVGGHDRPVLDLNRQAQQAMRCATLLDVVPGAGHLFEEPGALSQVGRLALAWFLAHLH